MESAVIRLLSMSVGFLASSFLPVSGQVPQLASPWTPRGLLLTTYFITHPLGNVGEFHKLTLNPNASSLSWHEQLIGMRPWIPAASFFQQVADRVCDLVGACAGETQPRFTTLHNWLVISPAMRARNRRPAEPSF